MQVKYIGAKINLKSLRDAILKFQLSDDESIVLHTRNFDDLVLEYRQFYGESLEVPFYLLGILIIEDYESVVPYGRVGIDKKE